METRQKRRVVRIGDRLVGDEQPCYVVAEIGINHNGSLELAKQLVDVAIECGCDAVKFQKRTVEIVYRPEELKRQRENPFGPTNGDLKRGLEFGLSAYREIDSYCRSKNIAWFASCWDEASVDFVEQFDPPCHKIASPCLTDLNLLRHYRRYGRPLILSTGMSTMSQIEEAVSVLGEDDLILLHCTSTYPAQPFELNLNCIESLRSRFNVPVGYSGHEVGLATSYAAAVMGACLVERHITLDRAMWGSDQAASVEPQGMKRLVRDIRELEQAMGDGVVRVIESELRIMRKLRRVG
jgi:N-acetylneuraminate synthase